VRESQQKELGRVAWVFDQVTACARGKANTPQSPPVPAPSSPEALRPPASGTPGGAKPRFRQPGTGQGVSALCSGVGDAPLWVGGDNPVPRRALLDAGLPAPRASRLGAAARPWDEGIAPAATAPLGVRPALQTRHACTHAHRFWERSPGQSQP